MNKLVAMMLGAALLMMGCESAQKADPASRTGGLSINMLAEREGNSVARYLVEQDGSLQFAGGIGAWEETYTWKGSLTDEEINAIRESVEAGQWFTDRPSRDDVVGPSRYTVVARQPGDFVKFVVEGDHPRVMPVYELIATAALRRHERLLNQLPRAGESSR